MVKRSGLGLLCVLLATACGGDDDSGPTPDGGTPLGDAAACPSGTGSGSLELVIDIPSTVAADVRVTRADDHAVALTATASDSQTLTLGRYTISAHRVRQAGDLMGPAYQGHVVETDEVCVRAGATKTVHVEYSREPGSARMWLTQSNGDGAQVMSFDAEQLASSGDQTPSVSLAPGLPNVGPIRVDGQGRLWVGTNTGKLVAFNTARMGSTSSAAPDVELGGSALCEETLPCGPRALAFDAKGALWVATFSRIVKLAPASLVRSGEPAAALTLASPDVKEPRALAFDADGALWVADADGAIAKLDVATLGAGTHADHAATVLYAQQTGPVTVTLAEPEGLVFDADGNLWVGYFSNHVVRLSKTELRTSRTSDDPLTPSADIVIGTEALVTDLTIDEQGNLWLPGGQGTLYQIAKDQLSSEHPTLKKLHSSQMGSVEKLTLNTVPGALFIAP